MQGLTLSQYEGEGISHGNWLMNGKHCVDRPDSSGVIISMPLKFCSTELHSFLFYSFILFALPLVFSSYSSLLRWKLRILVSFSFLLVRLLKLKLLLHAWYYLHLTNFGMLNYVIIQFKLLLIFPVKSA